MDGIEIIPLSMTVVALGVMAYMQLKLPVMRMIVRLLDATILRKTL